jgi:hypothetical protein
MPEIRIGDKDVSARMKKLRSGGPTLEIYWKKRFHEEEKRIVCGSGFGQSYFGHWNISNTEI